MKHRFTKRLIEQEIKVFIIETPTEYLTRKAFAWKNQRYHGYITNLAFIRTVFKGFRNMFQRSCWFTALTREIFSTLEENFRVSARQFHALCISIYSVLSIQRHHNKSCFCPSSENMFQRNCFFAALTCKIFSTTEENFRVSARPSNAFCLHILFYL